jgi:hypothetical protein
MVDLRRTSFETGRNWFNSQLAELLKYRTEYRELLRSPKHLDNLEYALGGGASLLALDTTVISLLGVFSAGKTTLLSSFLESPLPSERSPTSRIYTIIEPVEGLKSSEYYIAEIGQTDARRFLRMIAGKLGPLAEGARGALEVEGGVREAAAALGDYLLRNYDGLRSEKERLTAADAAFLCRSVQLCLGDAEFVTLRPLSDGANGFTAAEQACQHVAWDPRVQFQGGEARNGEALRARLDSWFRSDPLGQLRLAETPDADKQRRALTEIYRIGLRLGVIGYLKMRVPANATLRSGHLYADAPGRGGGSLLDTVMGDLVLQSAAAGVLVVNISTPGGIEQLALQAELQAKSAGLVFNHADGRLTGSTMVAEAVRRLGPDTPEADFLADTRTVVAEFARADALDLFDEKTTCRQFLSDGPRQAAKILLTFGMFGRLADQTTLCRQLTHLSAWLKSDRVAPDWLPPHLRQLAGRLPARRLTTSLEQIEPALPPKVVARLIGLLIQLGHDGGSGGMRSLLQAVETDSSQARFNQWCKCAAEVQNALKGVHLPPATTNGAHHGEVALPRPLRQAIHVLRGRIDPAAEVTRNRLESDLRLDHFYGPMNQPVEDCLTELCRRAVEGLPAAARKSAREGAVQRFQKVVEDLPNQLDLAFDGAIEGFVAHVKELLATIWQQVLDPAGYPDEPTKKLLARAADGLAAFDTCGQVGYLRQGMYAAFQDHWTAPLTAASPMESIPDERFDPTRHPGRFRAIALRVGRHRAATALIQAARSAVASTRDAVEAWLREMESRFRQAVLVEFAQADVATDPGTVARRRREQARQRFEVLQRECPVVIAEVDQALTPRDHVQA